MVTVVFMHSHVAGEEMIEKELCRLSFRNLIWGGGGEKSIKNKGQLLTMTICV